MSWQVWVRAAVMAASVAVIAGVGGRALVRPAGGGPDAVRPVALSTAAPSVPSGASAGSIGWSPGRTAGASRTPAGADAARPGGTPLMVSLGVAGRAGHGRHARILLRVSLADGATGSPVPGVVTLWRVAGSGRWTAVLASRETSARGVVDLPVTQRSQTETYQVTTAPTWAHSSASSPALTVRRR
ncbi:MAG TPA: hypothetical protein VI248_13835 [Kineosporiaceae bacterium]